MPRSAYESSTSGIGPVEVPKAAEIFADILRQKILRGDFAQGQPLPPERTLVEESRLSRATVRDSLAILKQQGLIVTRPGRNGGSIVTRPTSEDLVTSLEVYLQSQGWDADNPTMLEMREVMEPWCAALAAARHTDDDMRVIREQHDRALDALGNVPKYVEASQSWHSAVADASHNVLLSAFMRARSDSILSAASRARYETASARKATVAKHAEIIEAIAKRDPERAYELMAGHVRSLGAPLLDSLVEAAQKAKAAAAG